MKKRGGKGDRECKKCEEGGARSGGKRGGKGGQLVHKKETGKGGCECSKMRREGGQQKQKRGGAASPGKREGEEVNESRKREKRGATSAG